MSAIVSHKYKFIYPHIPRTGGTSLTDLILPHLGRDDVMQNLEKHQALRTLQRGFRRKGVFDNYTKFAVVRHPFDRIASLHQGYTPKCTMSSLIEQMDTGKVDINTYAFFWPIGRWITDLEGNNLLDETFRFEDGLGHAVQFLNDLGMPVKIEDLPHINKGVKNDDSGENLNKAFYLEQWQGLSYPHQEAFKNLYQWDYEAFGYE
jgi:hypothetical protein